MIRHSTATLGVCVVLVCVSTAACLGGPGVSNDDARERALTAEEQHIAETFESASCVEAWSLTSFVGLEAEATVVNRTSDGVYVDVRHPYSYSTAAVDADVESKAQYLVTDDDVERVDGTDVAPC